MASSFSRGGADDKYDGHSGTIWFLPSETSTGTLKGLNIELVDEDGDVCATKGYVGNNYQLLTGGAVSFNENILASGQAYETHGVMQVAASAGVETLLINGASVSLDGSETAVALNGYGTLTVAYDAGRGVLDYTYACDAPVTHQQSAEDTSLTRSFMVEMTTDDGGVEHSLFNVTIGDSVPILEMDEISFHAMMTAGPDDGWFRCGTCTAVDDFARVRILTWTSAEGYKDTYLDVRSGQYELFVEDIGTVKFVPGEGNTGTIAIQPSDARILGQSYVWVGVEDGDGDWTQDCVFYSSITSAKNEKFKSGTTSSISEYESPVINRGNWKFDLDPFEGDPRDVMVAGQKIAELYSVAGQLFIKWTENICGDGIRIHLDVPIPIENTVTGERLYFTVQFRVAPWTESDGQNVVKLAPEITLNHETNDFNDFGFDHCIAQVEGFEKIESLNWNQRYFKIPAGIDATEVAALAEVDVDDTVIPDSGDDSDEDSGEAAFSGAGAEDAGAAAQAEGVQEAEGAQEGAFLAATFAAGRGAESGETLEDDGETGREDVLEQMIGEEVSLASLENGGTGDSLQNSLFGEAEDGARESAGEAGRAAETSAGDAPGAGALEALLEEDEGMEALFTAPADSTAEETESVLFIDYNPTDYLIDGSEENLDILLANGLPEHTLADMLDNGARGDDQDGPMAMDVDALFSGDGIQSIQSIQDLAAYGVSVDPEAKTISLDATWAKDDAASGSGATTVYARDGMSLETTMIETSSSGDEITLAMHAIQSDTGNA